MAQGTQTVTTTTTRRATTGPRRPGWVTFAAVVTFVVAFCYAVVALIEFSNSSWFVTTAQGSYNLFSSHLFWWGIIDAAIAAIAVIAGLSMLRGGLFGLSMGILGAGLSMIRWLFYIPASPWLALTIIALDILVIYGLTSSGQFFDESNPL